MQGEADILQQRVQAVAVDRRRRHPLERVGGEQDERQEAGADHPLHRQGAGPEPVRQVATEGGRSEEHTSELQSLMRISYAVFCLKKKKKQLPTHHYKDNTLTQLT